LHPWTRFNGSATCRIKTHLNQDLDEDLGIGATREVVLGVTCNDCSIIQLLLGEVLTQLLVSSHGVS
jgi:hypothetical protein